MPVRRTRLLGGLAELATEHRLDQPHPREVRGRPGADEPAVAQHRDPVGHRVDLVEEVGDEDDAQSLSGKPAHHAEQDLDLVRVEARRRLVEDQHPGRQVDGAGDGDEVLDRDGVVAERRARVDREVELGEDGGGAPAHLAVAQEAEPGRLAVQEEVLRHREVRQQVHLLVDGGDAGPLRRLAGARRDGRAVERHRPGIARDDARHRLDQRRLAGAVLPEQRVDLARLQREIDAGERREAREALGEAADREERGSSAWPEDML